MIGAPWNLLISLVPEEGLEPSRGLTPPDFESGASAIPPLRPLSYGFGNFGSCRSLFHQRLERFDKLIFT